VNVSNLDPNLVAGLVTLVTTLAGWLYSKARGEKARDVSDLLDEVITGELEDALHDLDTLDAIEQRLTESASALLRRLHLDPKKYAGPIRVAVQWGLAEAQRKLAARRRNQDAVKSMPAQLDELTKATAGVLEAFKPKSLGLDIVPVGDVEIIK
jgi:hypothetical protein